MNTETQNSQFSYTAQSLAGTQLIVQQLAAKLSFGSCVYLHGSMGAGKTTLTKSIINALGYIGEVTSPTYNLVQQYEVSQGTIFHMDLYRLEDPSELEYLALEDLWSDTSLFLIEWPERGAGYLQMADAEISIAKEIDQPSAGRSIILKIHS